MRKRKIAKIGPKRENAKNVKITPADFTVYHLSLSVVTSSIKLISVTAVDYPTAQHSLTCT